MDTIVSDIKDKVSDKVGVPSALNAQKFEGDVKLTGHSFLDNLTLAITTIIIGLPAVNWFYSFQFKDKVPTIQCFPPFINESATANETITREDIESLCLYRHSLYAAFFPVLATFFGFGIAVLYFVWRNYNSSKLNLFVALVNEMKFTKDEQTGKYCDKNRMIVRRLTKIFSSDNNIYLTYLFVKVLQALFSLAAFVATVLLYTYVYNRSSFLSAFSDHYNVPTFYCKLDQFDFLNASLPSPEMQVPCVEFASLTTSLILLVDFILLFVIFVFTIASVFQSYPKELKYRQAAKFSFHTGMSHRLFRPKRFDFRIIACDLDFLVILLRRSDPGQADTLWDVRTLNEIKLLNNDDLMRTDLNYDHQNLDPVFRESIQLSEAEGEDLKWDLRSALGNQDPAVEDLPNTPIHLTVPANSFRAAIIGFSVFATRQTALYISLDSMSLGIPLALCRVFFKVYCINFDPYFKGNTDGKLYQVEEWQQFCQVTFPQNLLSSNIKKAIEIDDGINKSKMKEINFIVLGPIEDKTSHKTALAKFLQPISYKQSSGCLMLVITPAESHGTTKFFKFTPPANMHRWKVDIETSTQTSFEWLPNVDTSPMPMTDVTERTELVPQTNNKLCTPDGSFTFDLYTVKEAQSPA